YIDKDKPIHDSRFTLSLYPTPEPAERIVEFVHHAFLQWNDSVVGDLNIFRTNFRAALSDVAKTDPLGVSQFVDSVLRIERMHFQRADVNQKPRPDEFVMHLVVAQDVADILAKKTFDALSKLLDPIDVRLLHPPGAVAGVRWSRLERFDSFLHLEIPRHIGDQIFDHRERPHWFNRDRFLSRQIA